MPTHTFTINFSGLCLFLREGAAQDSVASDKRIESFLVPARNHGQILTFRATDLSKTPAEMDVENLKPVPDSRAQEVIHWDIASEGGPGSGKLLSFSFERFGPDSEKFPATEDLGEIDLSGLPSSREMGLVSELDQAELQRFTRVAIPAYDAGASIQCGPPITDSAGDDILWKFEPDGVSDRKLTNFVICKCPMPANTMVRVEFGSLVFHLAPPGLGDVEVAVTNLPLVLGNPQGVNPGHMGMYRNAFEDKDVGKMRFPEPVGALEALKPGVICPPFDGT